MKIGPINEMTVPAYRELNPVDNRNLEKTAEKVGAAQVNEIKEPAKPVERPEVNDGRETIGVSKDGDIAKASKAGLENINEGLVLRKTPEAIQRNEPERKAVETDRDRAEKTADDKTKAQTQSLISYSKDELERLYQKGEINSNQLDRELERREEIRGEKKDAADALKQDEKEEKKTNEEVATAREDDREYGVKQVTAQNNEVERSQKEAAEKQAEKVQERRQAERTEPNENRNEDTAAAENRKQIITEEMDRDDRFAREMTVLAGAEEDNKIKSEALETAVENDRLKLMEQVFNVDPATASNV